MIVVMQEGAPEHAVQDVVEFLQGGGCDVHRFQEHSRTLLGVVGTLSSSDRDVVREFPAVAKVVRISEPFDLASRNFRGPSTTLQGEYGTIGGATPWLAMELVGGAAELNQDGSHLDADAPRSGPIQYKVAAGGPFDAAVTRARQAPAAVGALSCLSLHEQPISPSHQVMFVARAPSWGADRWIQGAERLLKRREGGVVLLEQGGEYPSGAKTLEVAAIARARLRTHLPIVVDVPSVAQQLKYCEPVAAAAIGAGASGIILRVSVDSGKGRPRLPATLGWDQAVDLARRLRAMAAALRG